MILLRPVQALWSPDCCGYGGLLFSLARSENSSPALSSAERVRLQGNYTSNAAQWFIVFLTFWILYSYLVPISLFVTMELVKFWQVRGVRILARDGWKSATVEVGCWGLEANRAQGALKLVSRDGSECQCYWSGKLRNSLPLHYKIAVSGTMVHSCPRRRPPC